MSERTDKGLIQVYTGDGKGKTTAALGLAIRAVGHGMRVGFMQFVKSLRVNPVVSTSSCPGIMHLTLFRQVPGVVSPSLANN